MQRDVVPICFHHLISNVHARPGRYKETSYDRLVNRQQSLVLRCQEESDLRYIHGHMCPNGHIQPLSNVELSGIIKGMIGACAGVTAVHYNEISLGFR